MGACEHLIASKDVDAPVPPAERGAPGLICPDCREAGYEVWAHLRMCLTCGHVGCCDSSPHRHASSHFTDTGHPVMESFEPGESWRWCYLDRRLLP
ncbi:UBP-type zinc finger domain-containing protein [Actinomycetospora chiangmaiensis]|uniref:UBP-type zinc finger domain-containing protein n=1 Tax=Actinomycetospora chiangmaiensis TaxID=402650 RepID=UPI000367D059